MQFDEHRRHTTYARLHFFLIPLCAVGTVLLIFMLVKYSAYGIDFTDESFYLVWMANPSDYSASITQFGFLYHPIYILFAGDIASIRQSNIFITFVLAWCLTYTFLNTNFLGLKESCSTKLVISAALATSVFIIFDSWLTTPSYNSLNLQALLVTANGLILAQKIGHISSKIGWVLIGVGGWLSFMAKPSTALALAVCVLFYLFIARKYSLRMFALAASCVIFLLFISSLIIDGSVTAFVGRLIAGTEFASILGSKYTPSQILRIDEFDLNANLKISIYLFSVALYLALWSLYAENVSIRYLGFLVSIVFWAITTIITIGYLHRTAELGRFQGLLMFTVICTPLITLLWFGRLGALKIITAQQWSITIYFVVMPYVYAFGTNVNYWETGSSAAIFWVLTGLALLGPLIRERASLFIALPLAFAVQAATATLLLTGLEQPQRQPQPLRLNTSIVELGIPRSQLVLSESYARYLTSAELASREAGFKPNTPVIDLSGQSPGILYAIGASNLGQAWTIGGYPGSLELAEAALARTSCDKISAAWVLFEENGPRSIPDELMLSLGADFPNSYSLVGKWETAEGAGGYRERRVQTFYRPDSQNRTLMTCKHLRQEPEK